MNNKKAKTVIVLGSGGHTAEMMVVLNNLNKAFYSPRLYVVANTDKLSKEKVKQFEDSSSDHEVFEITRSREVKQRFVTAFFTTLLAFLNCFPLIWKERPDLVLCNGPGTCIPVCFAALILRWIRRIPKCKIVFIESFCRVKTLSLSGKLLKPFVDMFVVQWEDLVDEKSSYFGPIM
ncbi:ALG14 family protein [Megaselia abdita]